MKRLIPLGLALLLAGPLAAQERTRSPHGELKLDCIACHRSEGWTQVTISRSFDHNKFGFPLIGAHTTAACRACHQTLDFKGTPTTCATCHEDAHRGELGADCVRCHTTRSFIDRGRMARAHQLTRFPLEGAHLATDCTACHAPTEQGHLQFVARAADCISCHRPNYLAAKAPDHLQNNFPQDCTQCHSVTAWTTARFNHDASGFPLTGTHTHTACDQCHKNSNFQTPLGTQCVGCHQDKYNATSHTAARLQRLQHRLCPLPQHDGLERGVRPLEEPVPADRRPSGPELRAVPFGRRLQGQAHGLLELPSEGLQRHQWRPHAGPGAHAAELRHDLHQLP